MIFTVIAEDFGFMGSYLPDCLYLLLIYPLVLRITLKSNNQFYAYISTRSHYDADFSYFSFENIWAVSRPLAGRRIPALYFPRRLLHYQY